MCPFTYKIKFEGLVQGVGLRPFIYTLAREFKLCGRVFNDTSGVILLLNARKLELSSFIQKMKANLPPLARLDGVKIFKIKYQNFTNFEIEKSKFDLKTAPILPDFAICEACKKEFNSPKNARFNYPFITCTHCGVRFSIIKTLPYDRKNTSMSAFKMCAFCKSEYENPLNSRFHAQPISCAKCAIEVSLKDKAGRILASDKEAFLRLSKVLKAGKIVAIKAVGGFHLCCDALNLNTIKRLRELKNRALKPFALLCADEKMASSLAKISQKESKLLQSNIAPIVLLKKKKRLKESIKKALDLIAPNTDKIGIMLANQGLQMLIFKHFNAPLIATSANLRGESIIYDESVLRLKLSRVYDFCLDFDRDIQNPSDDSIACVVNGKTMFLRTSRGVNPNFISLSRHFKDANALALGSELKNEFVISYDKKLIISPYIGDLKSLDVRERFFTLLDFFKQNYDLSFQNVLMDKHPHFAYAKELLNRLQSEKNAPKVFKIQHHYAHACAVMFENKLFKTCLAFCFDGTGYGDDGAIWGGEVLLADLKKYERLAHFRSFKLINADIKRVKNLALSLILSLNLKDEAKSFLSKFQGTELRNLEKVFQQNKLFTSSLGRIIDAFAAVIFDLDELEFEAQAGLLIENFYQKNLDFSYEFDFDGREICVKNAFQAVLKEKDKIKACTGFLNALSSLIIKISAFYQKRFENSHKDLKVLLSGGVFQNKTLLEILHRKRFKFKANYKFPPNDSCIALGQMAHFLYKGDFKGANLMKSTKQGL